MLQAKGSDVDGPSKNCCPHPPTVLFYTRTWSLCKNIESSNHETDAATLEELSGATGTESRFLTECLLLPWTTHGRDFDGHRHAVPSAPRTLPIRFWGFSISIYPSSSESAEFALGCLLGEVISQSGDISMLDWVREASTFHSCFPTRITSYQTLPLLPVLPPVAQEQSSTASQHSASSKALRKLYRSLTKSPLPRFLNRRLTLPCFSYRVTAFQLKSANPSSPNYTYEMSPLPRFMNRRLMLPCFPYHVAAVSLRSAAPSLPRYSYEIHASGLWLVGIRLPEKLEDAATENATGSSLQLVRLGTIIYRPYVERTVSQRVQTDCLVHSYRSSSCELSQHPPKQYSDIQYCLKRVISSVCMKQHIVHRANWSPILGTIS